MITCNRRAPTWHQPGILRVGQPYSLGAVITMTKFSAGGASLDGGTVLVSPVARRGTDRAIVPDLLELRRYQSIHGGFLKSRGSRHSDSLEHQLHSSTGGKSLTGEL